MSESLHWYVVRSKPRREEYAQGQLLRRGVETFLPRILEADGPRCERTVGPLFPGYLFARIDLLSQYNSVIWAPGVRNFVAFGEVPAPVESGGRRVSPGTLRRRRHRARRAHVPGRRRRAHSARAARRPDGVVQGRSAARRACGF
jgi:hypothetical protein